MYERFTDRARKVMALANQEALRFQHDYLGTEHLLLGLIQEGSGVAATVLKNLDVGLRKVRQEVENIVQAGPHVVAMKELPQTPRAKMALEYSIEEARNLNHNYVGSEHLLLGLLREQEGVAAQVLMNLGLTVPHVREEVLRLLGTVSASDCGCFHPGKSKTPALDSFGRDLTALARQGKLGPVVARGPEIERAVLVLSCRTHNCPLLVGEAGVGKSAIVEGLAQRIARGEVPEGLRDRRVVHLDVELMAGASPEQFEERMRAVVHEVRRSRDAILFLDDLHLYDRRLDRLVGLLQALGRGELRCIGAATLAPEQPLPRFVQLCRRFHPLFVQALSKEQALDVLRAARQGLEQHHRVQVRDDALRAAIELGDRYLPARCLPDKALGLLDLAAAHVALRAEPHVPDLKGLNAQMEQLEQAKEEAVAEQDFDRAARLRDQWDRLHKQKENALREGRENAKAVCGAVGEEAVAEALAFLLPAAESAAPSTTASPNTASRLLELEGELGKFVLGQDDALRAVATVLRKRKAGLKDQTGPLGSFAFVGPGGVGQGLLARRLAIALFGDDTAVLTLSMSEYREKHTVSRLVGAPPGITGYSEPGALTEAVRCRPCSVVVFEEIEKAHPDVWAILRQIVQEGQFIDNVGRSVSFRNTILVLDASLADLPFHGRGRFPFGTRFLGDWAYDELKSEIQDELRKTFSPDLLNALDDVVVFRPLTRCHLKKVLDRQLAPLCRRLAEKNLALVLTDEAKELLLDRGTSLELGARPLRRAIEQHLEAPLAEGLLKCTFATREVITAGVGRVGQEKALVFHVASA